MKYPLLEHEIVAFDTETTGLRWALGDRIFGFSIAISGWSGYFDIRINPEALTWLRDQLPQAQLIIGQHIKFDMLMAKKEGIDLLDVPWHCTMITDALCNEHHHEYSLDAIAMRRLGIGKKKDLVQKWMQMCNTKSETVAMAKLHEAPFELVEEYALQDAELLMPIYLDQMKDIIDQDILKVYTLEMDLLPVLMDMEWGGVRCDVEAAHASIPKLTKLIDDQQRILNTEVGFDMNINSTPQVRKIFQPEKVGKYQYKLIDGTLTWMTTAGGPKIDQNVLKEMVHPAANMIRKLRKIKKLRDTFVLGHILQNVDERGYVHTTYNSTRNDADAGTVTGRLSSTDPAMQQINGRDDDTASILRAMFLPDLGDDWLGADYSSADFRIAAHYLNDPTMISAYNDNPDTDFHQFVADMTGIPRKAEAAGMPNAKTLNLSMAFGAGGGKIAMQMGMPFTIEDWKGRNGQPDRIRMVAGEEAERVLTTYHTKFPAFKAFSKLANDVARDRGYIMSLMGRRLRFPGGKDTHKAAGYLFQSGCAECMKTALVRVWRLLRGTPYRLFLTVHDELAISAPVGGSMDSEIHRVYTDYSSADAAFKLRVPMTSTFKRGPNWYTVK